MKKTTPMCELHSVRHEKKTFKPRKMRVFTTSKEFDSNGNLHSSSKYVDYNPVSQLKNLKVSDFDIESLNAAGVQLTPTSLSMSNHEFVTDIKSKLSTFENKLNSNN